MKRNIKLVGLDMDGTLLRDDKTVSGRTKEVLRRAVGEGVIVVPATGRPLVGLPEAVREIEKIRYAVMANGSSIYRLDIGELIYKEHIKTEDTLKFMDGTRDFDCITELYSMGKAYGQLSSQERIEDFTGTAITKEYVMATRTWVPDLRRFVAENQVTVEKYQMLFRDKAEWERAFGFMRKQTGAVVTSANGLDVEVTSKRADKGRALLALAEMLGISREEIMVCGDSGNDRTMFQAAGLAVAMGNARADIKELADFVTSSNEEDGVAEAMERFVLS